VPCFGRQGSGGRRAGPGLLRPVTGCAVAGGEAEQISAAGWVRRTGNPRLETPNRPQVYSLSAFAFSSTVRYKYQLGS
jgi:hypothetical protein